MPYITELQEQAEYYGGDYLALPAKVKAELCAAWIRERPMLEILDRMPERTCLYVFGELLGELVEHHQSTTGEPYKRALLNLQETLVPFALAEAERHVQEDYDTETAPAEDHGMSPRDFGEAA